MDCIPSCQRISNMFKRSTVCKGVGEDLIGNEAYACATGGFLISAPTLLLILSKGWREGNGNVIINSRATGQEGNFY